KRQAAKPSPAALLGRGGRRELTTIPTTPTMRAEAVRMNQKKRLMRDSRGPVGMWAKRVMAVAPDRCNGSLCTYWPPLLPTLNRFGGPRNQPSRFGPGPEWLRGFGAGVGLRSDGGEPCG